MSRELDDAHRSLSGSARRILYDLAQVAMPEGQRFPGPSWSTIDRLERV